jgi:tetratricopeptide (TPR) repeat protein
MGKGDKRIRRSAPAGAPPAAAAQAVSRRVAPHPLAALAAALLIITAGTLAYYNSFQGMFLFDDEHAITANAGLRRLWPPWPAMFGAGQGNRPLVGLSLAVNYQLGESASPRPWPAEAGFAKVGTGGYDPWGYHAFNLAVHLLAALVLFGLVRRTLLLDGLGERFAPAALALALAVALLWMVHPLQTESVTYIIQRSESLVGLALLSTLYLALRGFTAARPGPWYVAAVVTCALGMATKEVMLVAPVVVLAYDSLLVARGVGEALRRRWRFYLALAATWAVLAALVLANLHKLTGAALRGTLSPLEYALTQLGVIVHYLRLALWPDALCLSYEWPAARTVGDILPPAIIVAALVGATLWAVRRSAPLGFLGLWFFMLLAPTSSFWPVEDPAFEHRMYLPLAALAALAVIGGYALGQWALRRLVADDDARSRARHRLGRAGWLVGGALVAAAVLALSVRTAGRNEDYHSALRMWTDVVRKSPENPLGHNNLGNALAAAGRLPEAIRQLSEAVRLNPRYAEAHSNLGAALGQENKIDEALEHLTAAVALDPTSVAARLNLAKAWDAKGDAARAIEHWQKAVELSRAAGQQQQADALEAKLRLYRDAQARRALPARRD